MLEGHPITQYLFDNDKKVYRKDICSEETKMLGPYSYAFEFTYIEQH